MWSTDLKVSSVGPSRRHRNGHTLLTREDGNSHATLHPEDREVTVHSNQKIGEYCHAGLQPDGKRNSHVLLQPEDTGAVTLCFNQMTRGVVTCCSGQKIQEQPRCRHVFFQPADTGTVTLCFQPDARGAVTFLSSQKIQELSHCASTRCQMSSHVFVQPEDTGAVTLCFNQMPDE